MNDTVIVVLLAIIVILIFSSPIFIIIFNANAENRRNNRKPKIEQMGHVVDKRTLSISETMSDFYLTIQFADQQRVEAKVPSEQYGLIIVGDRVKYTSQGTRQTVERML